MAGEVVRRVGHRAAGEVGRRADDDKPPVRPYANRYHVLRHMFAEPHARVVAFGDDVGQPVLDVDLDLDIGKLRTGKVRAAATGSS